MKQGTYWQLQHIKTRDYKFVDSGFSIGAALFGPFWAIRKGSLILFAGFCAVWIFLYFLPQWVISPYSPGLSKWLVAVANIAFVVTLGLFSNAWYRMALESDGWKMAGKTRIVSTKVPAQIGEWVVRSYGWVIWPANELVKPTANAPSRTAGYLIGQHEIDDTQWQLMATNSSWTPIEDTPADSQLNAKRIAEERHPILRNRWVDVVKQVE